ncbi:hypothetical protein SEENIN0B_04587 [Salmonella enterica subsp. enterica serovar Infantis str. SARB27]|uniref:Uncharacterized protein n=1 Tax=Salmonella enterica subsp. enterica serovar Infantis str. SARB27 TaxID=596155 RepID=A0A6C8G0B2_SALIN|nr:hypothetical protein SEENIN0B_04587 [Salmonella enterica subsp. enterica serovar Infantis str. SARB27]
MHRPGRTAGDTYRLIAMVTSNREVVGKGVVMPAFPLFHPASAAIFIDAAQFRTNIQIFIILAAYLAGFTA